MGSGRPERAVEFAIDDVAVFGAKVVAAGGRVFVCLDCRWCRGRPRRSMERSIR
jgi:hypothetical protein